MHPLVLYCTSLALVPAICGGSDDDSLLRAASDLEQHTIQSRRAVRSGVIDFRGTGWSLVDGKQVAHPDSWGQLRHVVFKGQSVRYERLRDDGSADRFVFTEDRFIQHDNRVDPDGVLRMADVGSRESFDKLKETVFDPRRLGMVPVLSGLLYLHDIDSLLGRADRRDVRVDDGTLSGFTTKVLSFELFGGERVRYWIAPEAAYSVIRCEFEWDGGVDVVESDLVHYPDAGVWFPSRVTYKRWEDGTVTQEEVVTVESAVFGGEIADETFELAGLDLPQGLIVYDISSQTSSTWDGSQLVPRESRVPPEAFPAAPAGRSGLYLMLWLGGGVVALVLVVWSFRRRHKVR